MEWPVDPPHVTQVAENAATVRPPGRSGSWLPSCWESDAATEPLRQRGHARGGGARPSSDSAPAHTLDRWSRRVRGLALILG